MRIGSTNSNSNPYSPPFSPKTLNSLQSRILLGYQKVLFWCIVRKQLNFVIGENQRTKAMSDANRRHVTLRAPLSFFFRAMPFSLMKPWPKFLLVAIVCGFVGYVTVFVAPRRDMIAQRGNSSRALHLAQDIREEDRNFLDDLVQKQNQDDHHDGNPLSATDQNIGKAGTIVSSPKPVPRAELVINTEIVRRGEMVVHSGQPNLSVRPSQLSRQQIISQKP